MVIGGWDHEEHQVFETEMGDLGLGPWGITEEDLICLVKGCQKPLILRKIKDHFVLIGSCFVNRPGSSDLEERLGNGNLEWERIEIL
jgi:hypothetical protein